MSGVGKLASVACLWLAVASCGDSEPTCAGLTENTESTASLGCAEDFRALASRPLDATIPGARSVKTIVDRFDGDRLHFQNSVTFQTHYQFASKHLSGNGLLTAVVLGAIAGKAAAELARMRAS